MNLREEFTKRCIASDATYFGYVIADLVDSPPIVALCMSPYLSLFVHESYQKLELSNPSLAAAISEDVRRIVARSRHSLKLFEDNQRWIAGQLDYFRNKIRPAHWDYFIKRPRLGSGYLLGKDLGLYRYKNNLIATTYSAAFNIGIEPADLFQLGDRLLSIYMEYGAYSAQLGSKMTPGNTFAAQLEIKSFNQTPEDVRSNKYYSAVFRSSQNVDLRVLLTVFLCMMNFVDQLLNDHRVKDELKYSPFKIRYLTLYQVLASLKKLHNDPTYTISNPLKDDLDQLLEDGDISMILNASAKPFRNTLMHYNLDSRVDLAQVDLSEPLFGLVPIYFPTQTPTSFIELVDRAIHMTAVTLRRCS